MQVIQKKTLIWKNQKKSIMICSAYELNLPLSCTFKALFKKIYYKLKF